MHLKGALHVHTTCSDGSMSIRETVNLYENLGFDFIALTDHDYLLRPDCYEEISALTTKLIVFKGVELTVFEKGYVHVNRINGDREILHIFNHPADLDLPVQKVLERITSIAKRFSIDAVEITSKGFRTPEFDTPEIPYNKIATDDSHSRSGCGRAWVEMDCMRNKDSIISAIKKGRFWNCYAG